MVRLARAEVFDSAPNIKRAVVKIRGRGGYGSAQLSVRWIIPLGMKDRSRW